MNADLVKILTWEKPVYSGGVLVLVNLIFWFLIRQRPLTAISMTLIVYYLKHLWRKRIGPEILVDPPDSEEWTEISTIDLQDKIINSAKYLWKYWMSLRDQNHTLWTMVTTLGFIILARAGAEISFATLVILITNLSFGVSPIAKVLPVPAMPRFFNKVQTKKEDKGILHRLKLESRNLTPCSSTASMDNSSGPTSLNLTPNLTSMPAHNTDDMTDEEDFLFDSKHFDSASSSSSTSNSFEIIS